MRLIDADKLRVYVTIENNGINDTERIVDVKFTGTETVEAIPIEWIENWYKTHVTYLDENKPIGKGLYAFEQMIWEWRNENGKTN